MPSSRFAPAKLCASGTHRTGAEYSNCKMCVRACYEHKESGAKDSHPHSHQLSMCRSNRNSGDQMDWAGLKEAQRLDAVAKKITRHRRETRPRQPTPKQARPRAQTQTVPTEVSRYAATIRSGDGTTNIDLSGPGYDTRWSYSNDNRSDSGNHDTSQESLHSSGAVENEYMLG